MTLKIREKEKGSAIVLVMIVSLVLSAIVASSMNVTSKEMESASQNLLKKQAYYVAQKGIEAARNVIEQSENQDAIVAYSKKYSDTIQDFKTVTGFAVKGGYITGSFEILDNHLKNGSPPDNLRKFPDVNNNGWAAPQLRGYNLNQKPMKSAVWEVRISSKATSGKKNGYAEITAGIIDIANEGY